MKTGSFTFPDVAWHVVTNRRGALKEKGPALPEAQGPLVEGEGAEELKLSQLVVVSVEGAGTGADVCCQFEKAFKIYFKKVKSLLKEFELLRRKHQLVGGLRMQTDE